MLDGLLKSGSSLVKGLFKSGSSNDKNSERFIFKRDNKNKNEKKEHHKNRKHSSEDKNQGKGISSSSSENSKNGKHHGKTNEKTNGKTNGKTNEKTNGKANGKTNGINKSKYSLSNPSSIGNKSPQNKNQIKKSKPSLPHSAGSVGNQLCNGFPCKGISKYHSNFM